MPVHVLIRVCFVAEVQLTSICITSHIGGKRSWLLIHNGNYKEAASLLNKMPIFTMFYYIEPNSIPYGTDHKVY